MKKEPIQIDQIENRNALILVRQRIITRDAIRILREALGLSQQQVGVLLGVGTSTVSRWESHGSQGRDIPVSAAAILGLLALQAAEERLPSLIKYLQQPIQTELSAALLEKLLQKIPTSVVPSESPPAAKPALPPPSPSPSPRNASEADAA